MKDISQLSRAALEDTLGQIVDRLFLDINPVDCPAELRDQEVYNPRQALGQRRLGVHRRPVAHRRPGPRSPRRPAAAI
jgi:hypothetical protein